MGKGTALKLNVTCQLQLLQTGKRSTMRNTTIGRSYASLHRFLFCWSESGHTCDGICYMFVMASLSLKTNKTQTHTQLGDAVQVSLAEQAACLQE
jgi:hypothetical protein